MPQGHYPPLLQLSVVLSTIRNHPLNAFAISSSACSRASAAPFSIDSIPSIVSGKFCVRIGSISVKDSINEAYKHPGTYENLFWDDIVNLKLKELQLKVYPVMENQIIEIEPNIYVIEKN